MRKFILIVLVLLVVAAGVFAGVVFMQPAEYRVERKTTIAAPASEVFAQVNDFHKWDAWSPWVKIDPKAKTTFEGPTAGKGAIFKWAGNSEVGEGTMTILESKPNDHIKIKLDFQAPMAGTAITDFTFKEDGERTVVTWSMHGQNSFVGKAFCLFMNMDKMIGDKYEEGLASMKAVAEGNKK